MMLLKEVAPVVLTPVLGEFAAHLRLGFGFADDGAENALLERYLAAAIAAIEARVGQALIAREFLLQVAGWDRRGQLVLPIGPVARIENMRFLRDGGAVVLDVSRLVLAPGASRQRLTGPRGASLPPVPQGAQVEIEFTAGHGPVWEDVPGELRQAVLLLAASYYEDRHGEARARMPPGVMALLAPHLPARI